MPQYVIVQTRIFETRLWTGDNLDEIENWLDLNAEYFINDQGTLFIVIYAYPEPQVHLFEQGEEIVQQVGDRHSTERITGLGSRPLRSQGEFVDIRDVAFTE